MRKQNLTTEEVNGILDNFDYLLTYPNIVSFDLIEDDENNLALEIIEIDEISENDLELDNEQNFTEIPGFVEIPLYNKERTEIDLVEIPLLVKKGSVIIEDELLFDKETKIKSSEKSKWFDVVEDVTSLVNSRVRPVSGGYFISTDGLRGRGSLGTSILYKGKYRILSNNHVLAKNGNVGKWVYQPHNHKVSNRLAKLTGFDKIHYYKNKNITKPIYNTKDVAWFDSSKLISSQSVREIGQVKGKRSPKLNEDILMFGARTQTLKTAKIKSLTRRYRSKGSLGYSFWKNGIQLDKLISQPGDSGSAYIAKSDKMLIGLHRAGNKNHSSGCRI